MANLVLEMKIFIESDGDPEDVASTMDQGLDQALAGFPAGEVVGSDIEGIRPATEEETANYFEE